MAIINFEPSSEPTKLSPRYEVRQLKPEQVLWATAIVCHRSAFHSSVWTIAYPDDISRLHRMMTAAEYLIAHQIDSGMSFGIFDTSYVFKRPESAATGGALYWDANDLNVYSKKSGADGFPAALRRAGV